MRNEQDLRTALTSLERHAPDTDAVLAAVRNQLPARRAVARRRRYRGLVGGAVVSATAAGAAIALAMSAAVPVPRITLVARLTFVGQPASSADAAAVLRHLADVAAAQRTPALGPVLYSRTANWGLDLGRPRYGLNYRSHQLEIYQEWVAAAGSHFKVSNPQGKLPPGLTPSGGDRANPKHNPGFDWINPATLPSGLAALRRHLLGSPVASQHHGAARIEHARNGAVAATAIAHAPSSASASASEVILGKAIALMQSEPLRPAVRASLLRLIADVAQNPPKSQEFLDLGKVTDRAGHRGIAIGQAVGAPAALEQVRVAGRTEWKRVHIRAVWLTVYIFDPATGALLGAEYARCTGPVSSLRVANQRCRPLSYAQFLQIKAVRSLPAPPSGSQVSASPEPHISP